MPKTKLENKDVLFLAQKPEELAAVIEWLATPSELREPGTQGELAKQLHVTPQAISGWKRDPRVVSKIRAVSASYAHVDGYADAMDALRLTATDPSHPRQVSAAKLFFEEIGSALVEETVTGDLSAMSIAELKEHVSEIYDTLGDREIKTA